MHKPFPKWKSYLFGRNTFLGLPKIEIKHAAMLTNKGKIVVRSGLMVPAVIMLL